MITCYVFGVYIIYNRTNIWTSVFNQASTRGIHYKINVYELLSQYREGIS